MGNIETWTRHIAVQRQRAVGLFSPLGKLADRAIYFAYVNLFLFSFSMIARRTIRPMSGSAGPIFAIFSLNESVLGVDDRSGSLFRYLKGRCHSNQFCGKMANSPHLSLWNSESKWDDRSYLILSDLSRDVATATK